MTLPPSEPHGYNHRARPETLSGSTPAVRDDTTGAPKSRGIPLDEARLRPHLRMNQPATFTGNTETGNTLGAITETMATKSQPVPSPGELRGIPVIGHGGAIPGTDPATATQAKLDRLAS